MDGQILALVSKVRAPIVRTNAAGVVTGEIVVPLSTTANYIVIPDWLKGRYVDVTAIDADAAVRCGVSAADAVVVLAQESTIDGSRNVTVHASSGRRIPAGQTRGFVIPRDATHFGYDGSGSGLLNISLSSQQIE